MAIILWCTRMVNIWVQGSMYSCRDSLICKSFGVKILSYFLLYGSPSGNGYILGGDFGGYGENFLDRLKAAVNGPNSTTPVQITIGPLQLWKSGFSGFASSILMAFLYNLNLIADFTLWFIVIAAIGGIIAWGTWRTLSEHSLSVRDQRKTCI